MESGISRGARLQLDQQALIDELSSSVWRRLALVLVPAAASLRIRRPELARLMDHVLDDLHEDVAAHVLKYEVRRIEEGRTKVNRTGRATSERNEEMVRRLRSELSALLERALTPGFYGRVGIEAVLENGTIQSIQKRTDEKQQ